tara:strand:+ start:3369 stop:3536 length:168 start_codon:yes stop_codon:yes gene_type:complete
MTEKQELQKYIEKEQGNGLISLSFTATASTNREELYAEVNRMIKAPALVDKDFLI